jgi:hypothetical protein
MGRVAQGVAASVDHRSLETPEHLTRSCKGLQKTSSDTNS